MKEVYFLNKVRREKIIGTPEAAEKEVRVNGQSAFDRLILMKLKKRIEDAMVKAIDDIEFDDDSLEMLEEVATEIMCDPKIKGRIKAKVYEMLDEDKLVEKLSMKIISQLMK